ncbi:MAG: hypothetical protein QF830_13165, partial [Rhodospirillales bacterium]|nr:hypothetical protein [Rhodospirillales bacterium]
GSLPLLDQGPEKIGLFLVIGFTEGLEARYESVNRHGRAKITQPAWQPKGRLSVSHSRLAGFELESLASENGTAQVYRSIADQICSLTL